MWFANFLYCIKEVGNRGNDLYLASIIFSLLTPIPLFLNCKFLLASFYCFKIILHDVRNKYFIFTCIIFLSQCYYFSLAVTSL